MTEIKSRKFTFELDGKEDSIRLSKFPDDICMYDLYMIIRRSITLASDPDCEIYDKESFDSFSKNIIEDLMVVSVEVNNREEEKNDNSDG